ncbi:uncharacterized protein O3C94_022268 [Discoglossus pictus]
MQRAKAVNAGPDQLLPPLGKQLNETTSPFRAPLYKDEDDDIVDEYANMDDTCPLFKLMPNRKASNEVVCKRAEFVPGSCRLMKKLFRRTPADCSHQTTNIICEIKNYNPRKPQVLCHHEVCKTFSVILVGLYHSEIGDYIWKLFKKRPGQKQLLNVNILLLDSVSRHHFYRTLPTTIKEFRRLNKYHLKSGHVFDFELLQGIKGRTHESLQALFGGDEDALPMFDAFELPPEPINLNETLGKFKAYGYETLYMEDMCWLGEWGLVKEQRAMNLSAPFLERVKLFNGAINRAGIDRLDVSYSSCLILQLNKVTDVFHDPPSICYNGIHQHTYLLEYMEYFLSRFSSFHKPTFTFLILDTGHEDTGIRIKQVDKNLARHVSFLAHQPNTISFILSDHGNMYGRFVQETPESLLEMFHPFLFVIVPDQASKILGNDKMKALLTNQNRLISLIDVHFTIKGLLPYKEQMREKLKKYNINVDGLLSPISSNRTCKDVPRIHPNVCICQASYTLEKNNSYYTLFAEFALGYMNRQIVEMQTANSKNACPMLRATRFDGVRRRAQEGVNETIILFDLYVKSAGMVVYPEERFSVTVLYSTVTHMEGLLFLGYNRLTPYSIYKQCADSTVDIRLCVCEKENNLGDKTKKHYRHNNVTETVLWTRTLRSLVHKPCLYLLTRNYTSGVVLYIHNMCPDKKYNIIFNLLSKNMYVSNKMPVFQVLGPRVEKVLVVGIVKQHNHLWKYKYTLNFTAFHLQNS